MRYEPDFGRGWLKREFGRELRAFWRYLRRPRLSPRLRRPDDHPVWLSDWLPACPWRLLVAWLVLLWGVSILILGPVMLWAADASGAEHKLSGTRNMAPHMLLLFAVVVMPVVEELLFRYGLRRPTHIFWVIPLIVLSALAMRWFFKLTWLGLVLGLAVAIIASCCVMRRTVRAGCLGRWGWRWRRVYVHRFGWVFHGAALIFASVHLSNYQLDGTLWLTPLLVCSQWLGGLVMGWMRVTRSLGSSIALHGCFNGGAVLLLWLMQEFVPDLV